MSSDELATILRLVAAGTLSPDEAAPIIDALTRAGGGSTGVGGVPEPEWRMGSGPRPEPGPSPGTREGRQLRIRIAERGRQVVNLRIPLALADTALRMVPGLAADQSEQIRAAIAAGSQGPILDVEDENGDSVIISME